MNYDKSAFQTTKKDSEATKTIIQDVTGITNMTNLENYLGCPIINGRVCKETFSDILGKTNAQLSKWKANSISQAGRAVLIKSNLAAKPNYLMQSFMLPAQIHKELDRTNRCFLWNKDPKHSPLVGWDRVCTPKKYNMEVWAFQNPRL